MPVTIDELRDIHLPADLTWFQPSPVMWLLLLASLAAAALVFNMWRRSRRAANPLYRTRQALDNYFTQWSNDRNNVTYLHNAAATLKLLAITQSQRTSTARLNGDDWISWLNSQSSKALGPVGEKAFATEVYQRNPQTDITELHQALSTWLQHFGKPANA